jgi:hypothetical protein
MRNLMRIMRKLHSKSKNILKARIKERLREKSVLFLSVEKKID